MRYQILQKYEHNNSPHILRLIKTKKGVIIYTCTNYFCKKCKPTLIKDMRIININT